MPISTPGSARRECRARRRTPSPAETPPATARSPALPRNAPHSPTATIATTWSETPKKTPPPSPPRRGAGVGGKRRGRFVKPPRQGKKTPRRREFRRLGGLGDPHQVAQDRRRALEALLGLLPVVEEHDLHVGPHARAGPCSRMKATSRSGLAKVLSRNDSTAPFGPASIFSTLARRHSALMATIFSRCSTSVRAAGRSGRPARRRRPRSRARPRSRRGAGRARAAPAGRRRSPPGSSPACRW